MYQKVIGCTSENWETITKKQMSPGQMDLPKKIDTWDWDKISNNSNATLVVNDHNRVIFKKITKVLLSAIWRQYANSYIK